MEGPDKQFDRQVAEDGFQRYLLHRPSLSCRQYERTARYQRFFAERGQRMVQ